jgi:hypothetical protein
VIEGLLVFVMSCNILGFLILELLELEIVDSSEINPISVNTVSERSTYMALRILFYNF